VVELGMVRLWRECLGHLQPWKEVRGWLTGGAREGLLSTKEDDAEHRPTMAVGHMAAPLQCSGSHVRATLCRSAVEKKIGK
jgi:hypothetical protein